MLGCFSPALPTWSWWDGGWRVPCPIKLPVLSQLGCGRTQGREETEGKGDSQSIIPFFQARGWLRYSFFSLLVAFALRGREKGIIKKTKPGLEMLEGVSEIPNLVGHPMRALLS